MTIFLFVWKWVSIGLIQKAKDRYHNGGGKEKAPEYYLKNKGVIKEEANNRYRSLSEEKRS